MATRRQHRLNELLQEELSMLVPGRVDDPRIEDVTITRVETTQDMGTAKVYFASATEVDEAGLAEMHSALQHASNFLRQELGSLGLRRIPRLVFAHDRAFESGQRVLEILGRLGSENESQFESEIDIESRLREHDASEGPDPTRAETDEAGS